MTKNFFLNIYKLHRDTRYVYDFFFLINFLQDRHTFMLKVSFKVFLPFFQPWHVFLIQHFFFHFLVAFHHSAFFLEIFIAHIIGRFTYLHLSIFHLTIARYYSSMYWETFDDRQLRGVQCYTDRQNKVIERENRA